MIKNETADSCPLTSAAIDELSKKAFENLIAMKTDKKEATRIRLSVEDILYIWMKELGENAPCRFVKQKRLGKEYIKIVVRGKKITPSEMSESAEYSEFLYNRLLSSATLHFSCTYENGENIILIAPPQKKRISQTGWLLISATSALFLGVLLLILPDAVSNTVATITNPIFDMMMNALKTISSPLILCAICCSIIGMGNICELGKTSKRVVFHMLKTSFAFYSVSVLLFIFLFPIKLSGSEGNLDAFSGLYQMLLDIVPTDIISPFVNGNALQIIFIGVILGVTIFIAGDRATLFRDGFNQANTLLDIISEMLMKATGICFS